MQVPQPPPKRSDDSDRPNSGGRSIRTGWAEQKTSYESKCDDDNHKRLRRGLRAPLPTIKKIILRVRNLVKTIMIN